MERNRQIYIKSPFCFFTEFFVFSVGFLSMAIRYRLPVCCHNLTRTTCFLGLFFIFFIIFIFSSHSILGPSLQFTFLLTSLYPPILPLPYLFKHSLLISCLILSSSYSSSPPFFPYDSVSPFTFLSLPTVYGGLSPSLPLVFPFP